MIPIRLIVVTGLLATLFAFSAPSAVASNLKGFNIQPDPDNPKRVLIHVDALINDVPGKVDQKLKGRLGFSCSKRVFWVGRTSIRGGGQSLQLATDIRYEQWVCAILKSRIFRSTHRVYWKVSLSENARIDNLVATAEITNIKKFPGELEQWLGLRMKQSAQIPIPTDCGKCKCSQLVDQLVPVATRFRFHPQRNGDVLVKATFSASRDLSAVARCF